MAPRQAGRRRRAVRFSAVPKTRRQKLRGYLLSATAVALGLIALGFIALWAASRLKDETAATVVREFAAVLLALGVLELAHRFVLERSLVREILGLVRLEQRLLDLGLDDLTAAPPDWADFFSDGDRFAVLPPDPLSWLRSEWVRVLDRARRKKVDVSIYVPAWNGPGHAAVAGRLGVAPQQFAADLSQLVRGVSDTWAHGTDLTKGSKLAVYVFDDVA